MFSIILNSSATAISANIIRFLTNGISGTTFYTGGGSLAVSWDLKIKLMLRAEVQFIIKKTPYTHAKEYFEAKQVENGWKLSLQDTRISSLLPMHTTLDIFLRKDEGW